MTTTIHPLRAPHVAARRRPTNARGLLGAVAWLRWRMAVARDRRALESMPEYLLRDIGLRREEIADTVLRGRARPRFIPVDPGEAQALPEVPRREAA
ncbi:DUF1127 domain-containing protein [Lutibaculum baratangense]|uniref:DUF1127 domain-containing protein n=1 Tax=Lutibaculum baratangense TaxID=1358440 RepID=UPI000590B234|nr:DUF1127 domain-containing protein [Lutibaculum baratangense]